MSTSRPRVFVGAVDVRHVQTHLPAELPAVSDDELVEVADAGRARSAGRRRQSMTPAATDSPSPQTSVEVVVVLSAERDRVIRAEGGDAVAAHDLFAQPRVAGAQNVPGILRQEVGGPTRGCTAHDFWRVMSLTSSTRLT